ncbi:MAG: hypothetical protein CL843_07795 [Crocinitomicaceae bacterium]|nr:hypothetical protein [Crocinitomicaceae bacterium]|tara:strand:+ start:2229 stop:3167 length:939 start_codon:yes stop_codon:yes gene_type:complete
MAAIDTYQFTQLSKENVHYLIPLFQRVFGITLTRDHLMTKYFSTLEGVSSLGYFALFEGSPVAFFGGFPSVIAYQEKVELAVQCGDVMTLEEHRGKGLFGELYKHVFALFQEKGVRFMWAFLNQDSEYAFTKKLNWKGEKRMKCFTIPVAAFPTEKLFRRTKVFEKYNQQWIRKKLSDRMLENKQVQSVDLAENVGVCRNKAYFDFKNYTPNFCIDVEGTAVWIKPLGGLLVGDMEVISQEQVLKTVDGLKRIAQKVGIDKIILQVSEENKLYHYLSPKYPSIDSWLIGYKNINSDFPLETLDLTYGDLDTF